MLITIFSSCSTIKELEYNVTQNPLHMKGGDVTLQINGKFIEKGLNAKAIAEITPILFCKDGNEIPFLTEIYQGPKAAGNGKQTIVSQEVCEKKVRQKIEKRLSHYKVTVDYNGQQIDGSTKDVLDIGDLKSKFESFGWKVLEIENGNSSGSYSVTKLIEGQDFKRVYTLTWETQSNGTIIQNVDLVYVPIS